MTKITYESVIVAMQHSDLESMAQDWIIEKLKKLQSIESAELQRTPVQTEQKCPSCDGRGWNFIHGTINEKLCSRCNGRGVVINSIGDEDYTPRVHTVSCGCVVCRRQRRRTPRAADSAPPYTAEELDIITDPRRNGALQDPPSQ